MNKSSVLAISNRWNRLVSLGRCVCLAIIVAMFTVNDGLSQVTSTNEIQDHLSAGEFPIAIEMANRLGPGERDDWLARIAKSQMNSGAGNAAYQTAEQVVYDTSRAEVLNDLSDSRFGQPNVPAGQAGGITLLDFQNLIELIQNTIAVDSWEDTGTGLGTIRPFPAGVYVDTAGTLHRIRTKSTRGPSRIRELARWDSGNRDVVSESDMRKISLTRLEKAAQSLAAQGKPVDSTMQNLAGIYEIKFLMMYPETGDIVISGPAGPWKLDRNGRKVNVKTGKPILQLDDLVVCLRNAWEEDGKFGCSITPRKQNLSRTKQFLDAGGASGKRWPEKLRQTLGQQDIEVWGVDPESHAARVIIEADYRMKLVGMGLDPTIPEVPSYLDRVKLNPDGTAPDMDVIRWWFTLNYDDIVVDQDRTIFAFQGTGVKVLSENEFIDDQGGRIHTGKSNGATKEFAEDFTLHFGKLADRFPVYGQLKNVFDLALVANLIREQSLAQKTEWHRTFFDSPTPGRLSYLVRKERAPHQVDSVINEKTIRVRKQSSTIAHQIVGVSGGVSYDVSDILSKDLVEDTDGGELEQLAINGKPNEEDCTWWWD